MLKIQVQIIIQSYSIHFVQVVTKTVKALYPLVEYVQEESHTIGLLPIQIDKYKTLKNRSFCFKCYATTDVVDIFDKWAITT